MKNPAAVALGKLGGSVKSASKSAAAWKNGKKGGRPASDRKRMIANLPRPDFSRRIPQLDGLRGVAILMVVAYHYLVNPLEPHTPSPWLFPLGLCGSGVDLFFVLSGFLIGGILLDARDSGNYFRVFYIRRVCRIFPVYFAFLAAILVAARFLSWPVFHPLLPWQVQLTFTQNIWVSLHPQTTSYATAPLWSLAVEEQFYLLLPALVYFAKPSRLPSIVGAGIIAAPLIRLGIYLTHPEWTAAMFTLLPCRMNNLLLGVAAAYLVRQPKAWSFLRTHWRRVRDLLAVLAVGCCFLLGDPRGYLQLLIGFDYLAVFYTVLLIASLVDDDLATILRAEWLRQLGGIAYCVYLIHYTMYGMARHLGPRWAAPLVALPLTIVIAKISWKWFERPFIHLGHRANYSGHRRSESEQIAAVAVPQPAAD